MKRSVVSLRGGDMGRVLAAGVWLLLLLVVGFLVDPIHAAKRIQFASPLQSLTIPDPDLRREEDHHHEAMATPRSRFLPRFKAGLQAEVDQRRTIAAQRTLDLQLAAAAAESGEDWVQRVTEADRNRRSKEDELVEKAFDKAVSDFDKQQQQLSSSKKVKPSTKSNDSYQFVGVVNRKAGKKPITWYARPKPLDAKWSVRLVHVNQDAIIKDLFNRGKVDVFAKYRNTGTVEEETNAPIIMGSYEVRERSWKNFWNVSPKHMFTDSSGNYWRERRLRPGLYTDGVNVFESSYRYTDGRNGMHRVSGFRQFLNSKTIKPDQKQKILQRLQRDPPDVVLELSPS